MSDLRQNICLDLGLLAIKLIISMYVMIYYPFSNVVYDVLYDLYFFLAKLKQLESVYVRLFVHLRLLV